MAAWPVNVIDAGSSPFSVVFVFFFEVRLCEEKVWLIGSRERDQITDHGSRIAESTLAPPATIAFLAELHSSTGKSILSRDFLAP